MKEYNKRGDNFLNEIIRIPKRNLESKIELFETEIQKRQQLSDSELSELLTLKLQIRKREKRQSYQVSAIKDTSGQIWQLEVQILSEMKSCLCDILEIKEKLLEAKEELEMNSLKIDILK